ncbi:hypothetical protein TIFTF001_020023 [Ficus carica]|uniref:Uncharacterized protein n=1 Tax=Ficus carica TaxID=3494 RepID=A0AA88ACU0_FICCA|nr:hypothetical protein TIFTF001_020023 [Ficus carica]
MMMIYCLQSFLKEQKGIEGPYFAIPSHQSPSPSKEMALAILPMENARTGPCPASLQAGRNMARVFPPYWKLGGVGYGDGEA